MALTSCNNAPKDGQKADGAASRAVLENIATRTSVRAYTSEPVPEEMVEQLLRAGMAAPSAMNRQPWEFIVVNDRVALDTLAAHLK